MNEVHCTLNRPRWILGKGDLRKSVVFSLLTCVDGLHAVGPRDVPARGQVNFRHVVSRQLAALEKNEKTRMKSD